METHPVLQLFLKYAAVDTKSEPGSDSRPSSPGQQTLIGMIKDDLLAHGVAQAQMIILSDGSLLVRFRGTTSGKRVCYAAHVDTSPEAAGGATCIVHNYSGGDLALPEGDVVIPAADLVGKEGKTIVTASGETTLGADDKAGVAILVQVACDIASGVIANYPPVDFWFCVDEEIGRLDIGVIPEEIVRSWNALITLDGGNPQVVDTDCFCGWETIVEFSGQSAHPGEGGDKLKPAHYAMARLIKKVEYRYPQPWKSSGRQSFAYVAAVTHMTPAYARAEIIPRSFDPTELQTYHVEIAEMAREIAGVYGVTCTVSGRKLMYVGTGAAIRKHPDVLVPILLEIHGVVGKPQEHAIRSGTDGAMANMRYPDLPAPNLGVGMYNFHGTHEFLVVEEMVAMYEVMQRLIPSY